MDTKPINDKFDPTTIAAPELPLQLGQPEDAVDESGSEEAGEATPADKPAAKQRRAPVEYAIHRLAGRTVPRRGRR